MSQAIVLAADGSEHSDRAIQWYCDFLHQDEHVLHVVTSSEIPKYMAENKPLFEEDKRKWEQMVGDCIQKAQRVLNKYIDICDSRKVNCVEHLENGSPGDAIIRVATEVKASYVVIGSRGCSAIHNFILGSCSDYVVHHAHLAHCAVVVVPPVARKHELKTRGSKKEKQQKE